MDLKKELQDLKGKSFVLDKLRFDVKDINYYQSKYYIYTLQQRTFVKDSTQFENMLKNIRVLPLVPAVPSETVILPDKPKGGRPVKVYESMPFYTEFGFAIDRVGIFCVIADIRVSALCEAFGCKTRQHLYHKLYKSRDVTLSQLEGVCEHFKVPLGVLFEKDLKLSLSGNKLVIEAK